MPVMAQKTTTDASVIGGPKTRPPTMATAREGTKTMRVAASRGLRKRPATIAGERTAPMGAPRIAPQKKASGTSDAAAAAMPMMAPAVMENVMRQPARDADSRVGTVLEGMGGQTLIRWPGGISRVSRGHMGRLFGWR